MELREAKRAFVGICDVAMSIEEQAIEASKTCVQLIEATDDRHLRALTEEMLAAHMYVVAGVGSCRSTVNYVTENPLYRLYELEPWKYRLKVCEALLAVVTNTTLHPASFEALLQIIPRCKEEIEESKKRGAIAYPQGETLLRQAKEAAWRYLYCSAEVEIPKRGFREILDRWIGHDDPEVSDLAQRIKDEFTKH